MSTVHTGGVECGVFCWQVRLGTLGEVVRVNSKSTFAIAVVTVLVGCTVGPGVSKHGALTLDCIAISWVERWRALDPYHVVVYLPDRSAAYLFELNSYCQHLAQEPTHISISARAEGQMCARSDDALLVDDQRCVIGAILPYKTSA